MNANSYAEKEHKLTVCFISHKGIFRRSDAFLMDLDGSVILLDAGLMESPFALAELMRIRGRYLKDHIELMENKDVKLSVTWVVSHMHIDHVGAFLSGIAESPYIEIERAYLPPKSVFYDALYSREYDGDYKYRARIDEKIRKYQKGCEVIDIPFGPLPHSFAFASAEVHLLPPVKDWGSEERAVYLKELYPDEKPSSLPVEVTNSNSMWLLLEYKKRKFLFTGDTLKKRYDGKTESLDEMTEAWHETYKGVDVVKYPHHGYLRDAAAPLIAGMKPSYIVFNAIGASASDALKGVDKDIEKKCTLLSSTYEDVIFTVDENGVLDRKKEGQQCMM